MRGVERWAVLATDGWERGQGLRRWGLVAVARVLEWTVAVPLVVLWLWWATRRARR